MTTDRRTVLKGLALLTALQGAGTALRSRPAAAAPADAPITIDPNPG